jgi:hypothetical protein
VVSMLTCPHLKRGVRIFSGVNVYYNAAAFLLEKKKKITGISKNGSDAKVGVFC